MIVLFLAGLFSCGSPETVKQCQMIEDMFGTDYLTVEDIRFYERSHCEMLLVQNPEADREARHRKTINDSEKREKKRN